MYQECEATKVINRRNASKLYQVILIIDYKLTYVNILLLAFKVYSLAVEKRSLIAYDNKRVLPANLEDGEPNSNTHAYGHYSLATDVHGHNAEKQAGAVNDLQIELRAKK